MEETKQELLEESQRYMDADCPKEAAAWKRYALNEGHVYQM